MSFDVYAAVTDRIIEQLEKGVVPWRKPWTGTRSGAYSRSTGRAYSLLNQMLLGRPGEYLTFKQCKEAGGTIRKGEKGSLVVFWKMYPVTETNSAGETVSKVIPLLKYYTVFHIDQCEGIKAKYKLADVKPFDPVEEAERVCADYLQRSGVTLQHEKGDSAFYRPSTDSVTLPLREQFDSAAEYYGTLFHELTHSTGHSSRLNRLNRPAAFGSEEYSKEELVAEIGAASIVNYLHMETPAQFKNAAAYIASWLRALKNDKRLIVSAASKAEKAFELIVNEA